MTVKKKILISSVIVIGAVFYLIMSGFSNVKVHVSLEELIKSREEYQETYVQTEGRVLGDSVDWDASRVELTFVVTGLKDSEQTMPVLYNKPIPDNFQNATEVLVGGYYSEDGVFRAEEMVTKCPSKYEAELE
ncbi:cytochrome c maturation protein CcmE [Dehalobacterium formicoaceticum]|uniref:Cytochrome c maturation protein CcmE n=1 Tax=Dehalobacterium formicoaceticum TaxID=51515 RepID=A0ABT1Y2M8_9FIRM|nr:cytochrome c maturation protein CcmE [Dehalobacterium formicoaceticum]MCR6545118.1 cytochrome c maturation protein CcmE [Dehalobacterium formicoaceticum]